MVGKDFTFTRRWTVISLQLGRYTGSTADLLWSIRSGCDASVMRTDHYSIILYGSKFNLNSFESLIDVVLPFER